MTTPGYPDWERLVRSGGDPVAVSRTAITTTKSFGPFNVQQWETIMLWALTPAGSDVYQINWLWYDTQSLDNLLSSIFQTMNANQEMPIAVPVAGPWLVIKIVPKAGGNNTVPVFTFFGMSGTPSTHAINTYSGPLFHDTEQLSANENITWTLANQHYGYAIVHMGPDTAAMTYMRIRYFDWGTNALQELYRWGGISNTNPLTQLISLPAAPLVVDYTNGATVQFITASLMPAPS